MIILKTLKWSNCFSYGENIELDLRQSTLTQLVGTNGVGKSSIPLILEEVLFNKNLSVTLVQFDLRILCTNLSMNSKNQKHSFKSNLSYMSLKWFIYNTNQI